MQKKKIRNLVIAVIICAAVIILAAVVYINSKVTSVSLSKQIVKALNSTSSLHSVDTINFAGSASQQGINFDVALQAVDDNKVSTDPSFAYSERTVDMSLLGSSTTQKNYIYVDGDAGMMYASTDGTNWYSQTAEGTVYSIRTQTMEAFFEEIADEKLEAELVKGYDAGTASTACGSSDYAATQEPAAETTESAAAAASEAVAFTSEADVYTLTADVSGDLLKEMMTGMLTSIEGETSNRYDTVDWNNVTAEVRAYISKDSRLPVRITVDCPELGSQIMRSSTGGSDSTSLTCRTFSVQVDLDGYGETKVDIPEEIRNEAPALIGGTDEEAAAASTTGEGSTEIAPAKEP